MASTNPARGMRDFLPVDVRKREYVIGVIKQVYESYGFEPLETPAVENIETLMGKYGDEGNQLIFPVLKRGAKLIHAIESIRHESDSLTAEIRRVSELSDLALRYDLTVPLARVVADKGHHLPKYFKRYQIQPVWRADRPARGRFREFFQCDADAIGSRSILIEAEILTAVCTILTKLGFKFIVQINHRKLLSSLLQAFGIPEDLHAESLIAIDKFDKVSDAAMVLQFTKLGLAREFSPMAEWIGRARNKRSDALLNASDQFDDVRPSISWRLFNDTLLTDIRQLTESVPGASDALDETGQLIELVQDTPTFFNPFLARGLSYYTGTIMEINVLPAPGFSDFDVSIGGGGRYDGLIGMFGKEQIPACGFSLGLERILVVMDERGMFPPEIAESAPADVMVTVWNDETVADSLKLASELRAAGFRVTVYPEPDKLGKQMKYADAIKVPWVCVLGESEIGEGKVTVKNMKTGNQETLARSDAATKLKEKLSAVS